MERECRDSKFKIMKGYHSSAFTDACDLDFLFIYKNFKQRNPIASRFNISTKFIESLKIVSLLKMTLSNVIYQLVKKIQQCEQKRKLLSDQ